MDASEAKEVVLDFCEDALQKRKDVVDLVRKSSWLKHSPAKIKQAYFIYTENLYKEGRLTKELADTLVETYSTIGTFVLDDDDAEKANELYHKFMSSTEEGKKDEGMKYWQELTDKYGSFTSFQFDVEDEVEIHNFIADLQNRYH